MPRDYRPKAVLKSLVSRRAPSLFSRGGPDVKYSGERDPKFIRPAPPTRDRGIGRAQLRKFLRQSALKAHNITRSRGT